MIISDEVYTNVVCASLEKSQWLRCQSSHLIKILEATVRRAVHNECPTAGSQTDCITQVSTCMIILYYSRLSHI